MGSFLNPAGCCRRPAHTRTVRCTHGNKAAPRQEAAQEKSPQEGPAQPLRPYAPRGAQAAPQRRPARTFRRRRRLPMAILLPPAPAVAERTFKSARGTEQHARLPSFSHGTKGRQAQGARRQRGPAFVGSAKRDTPRERRRQPPPSRLPVARASTTGRSKMAQSKVAYGNALGGNRPSGRQGRGAGRFLPGMPARGRRVADAAGLGLSCARDAATAAPTRS